MLRNNVAVVAGASRGCGRGIALALGEAGATVYVTGRTVRDGRKPADGAPGTIQDTAEEVTRRGGRGIAVQVDHTEPSKAARRQSRYDLAETTEYSGRAVAALASDPQALAKTGKLMYVADLAEEYGFTDVNGQRVGNFYRALRMIP